MQSNDNQKMKIFSRTNMWEPGVNTDGIVTTILNEVPIFVRDIKNVTCV